ncbi:TPA: hypothetical protein OT937_002198 [Pseudomonas aeruginosa]|uniref:hypothetical protein n=1 Tax=Pseudomonas aeruginosa TaxID=287 RepID=UPI0027523FED|nr:hypothetical protein [Pseudomonas aeruginosa]HCT8054159.1 hypothetical protein [Pseudomonas aeruginosa]
MSIDWNTAPEGATHWEPAGLEFHEGWMKKEGNGWFFWGLGAEWKYGGDVSAEREATFEARPQEAWDGQGLPPVGVRVSVFDDGDLVYGHGESGEVIAHVEDCAVIRMSYGLGCFTAKNLRTPEQIAAEERRKSILHLANLLIDSRGQCNEYSQAEAIFDAGYRRQEEGK